MPSSLARGLMKARSVRQQLDAMRGQKYAVAPDIIIPTHLFAAADLTGANSGFFVFIAPADMIFLGYEHIHAVAGTNTLRVKKILAAATSAAGAAADANNVDISTAVALTGAANTRFEAAPVSAGATYRIAQGDKIAIASAAGTATLAGARGFLRLAFA